MSTIRRKITRNDVFSIGYGATGSGLIQESDEERFKFLDAAYEAGCTHWDTVNEKLLGKWFKRTGKCSEIFLAGKFGFTSLTSIDGSSENARKTLDEALKKLQTDYIDLYYLHRPDPNMPIEISIGTLAEFFN
ncbi:hypothetical protein ACEPAH_2154 [Sanghuangporus vaninii]